MSTAWVKVSGDRDHELYGATWCHTDDADTIDVLYAIPASEKFGDIPEGDPRVYTDYTCLLPSEILARRADPSLRSYAGLDDDQYDAQDDYQIAALSLAYEGGSDGCIIDRDGWQYVAHQMDLASPDQIPNY